MHHVMITTSPCRCGYLLFDSLPFKSARSWHLVMVFVHTCRAFTAEGRAFPTPYTKLFLLRDIGESGNDPDNPQAIEC